MKTNILSPLQYIALGRYIAGMLSIESLAASFGTTPDIIYDIVKNTDIRRKLRYALPEDQFYKILGEFEKEVALKIR